MPRRPSFETVQYHQRILELDPIAYWIQDEKVGTVSYDWVRRRQGSDQDGAYTGVTLGQPGIGDGRTSPYFDGVNDFNNIFTATFQGRFNGGEGSCLVWARVVNAGVWTDGAARDIIRLRVDADNQIYIRKTTVNNQIEYRYEANNVSELFTVIVGPTTDWVCYGLTWSISAGVTGEVRAFLNGVQQGVTAVGLGVWVGNLAADRTVIGAGRTIGPASPWHGYIAHGAVYDRALTPQELS